MTYPVMCVSKHSLHLEEGINTLSIQEKDIHFIQREIVDSSSLSFHAVGAMFPQLLPYIAVKCGDEYLTYARKGTETRLHGKRSMGFGGHVDLTDWVGSVIGTLEETALRELAEELVLHEPVLITNDFIYSNYDKVSQVHLGVIGIVEIEDKSLIKPNQDEVLDPQWLSISFIRSKLDRYERWSQILAKYLDN